jgi:hypothetical protein
MAWSRRVEVICGVAAGVLGLVALGVALFAPLGTIQRSCTATLSPEGVTRMDCSTAGVTHVSIAQVQGLASLTPVIALIGAILIGIAVFACWHSTGGGSLALLWVSTALLCAAMVLTILSIGIVFAPSALLALIAAITGSLPDRRGAVAAHS